MTRRNTTKIGAILGAGALVFTLASCATDDAPAGPDDNGTAPGAAGTITLGFIPSWTDGLSTAYLLENQLTKLGYNVEMQTLTEAGVLYTALAGGDVDIYPSAWPELTHAEYMTEYEGQIEDLGAYYQGAKLTIAVPSYTDIDSLEDLTGNADMFDGQIIGIEPGAGLTAQTENVMMPEYDLTDDYDLVTSSTGAMLAELRSKMNNEEDVAVTLWRPFWAYGEFDLKDLADPKGAMGDPEALHFLGTAGFADEFPEAAEFIAGIALDDEAYASLEDTVVNQYGEGEEAEAVAAWLADNPGAFETQID
ncbi:glycine betaine ABC transporter substrate-binding protein [Microbacterium amylolyticum]|nr:glycine betaine ABC transporter substrate-binding protein [Microbacterium amylolyticum]